MRPERAAGNGRGRAGSAHPVAQSAVDVARVEPIAARLDQLVKTLRPKLPSLWSDVFRAQVRASSFEFEMVDLRRFCSALIAATGPSARDRCHYKDLDFCKRHQWDELLRDFFIAVRK